MEHGDHFNSILRPKPVIVRTRTKIDATFVKAPIQKRDLHNRVRTVAVLHADMTHKARTNWQNRFVCVDSSVSVEPEFFPNFFFYV